MKPFEIYYDKVTRILDKVKTTQGINIQAAADWVANTIKNDRIVYVFGTGGHSYMAGEEVMYRAGGLAPMSGILDSGVSLANGAWRTSLIERTPGYAKAVLKSYGVKHGDVLLIVNNSGLNTITIDAVELAHDWGAKVIGITSTDCSKNVPADHPARHSSGKNLFEVADMFIDTCVPMGDALVEVSGCEQKVGPVSTIIIAYILNSIIILAVDNLVSSGITPPVWRSANIPGGDEYNKVYLEKYSKRVKHL